MMRLYIAAGLVFTLITGIWYYGNLQYTAGKRDLLREIEKARAASVEEKKEIDNEINQLDGDELLGRALDYVRNPER